MKNIGKAFYGLPGKDQERFFIAVAINHSSLDSDSGRNAPIFFDEVGRLRPGAPLREPIRTVPGSGFPMVDLVILKLVEGK